MLAVRLGRSLHRLYPSGDHYSQREVINTRNLPQSTPFLNQGRDLREKYEDASIAALIQSAHRRHIDTNDVLGALYEKRTV